MPSLRWMLLVSLIQFLKEGWLQFGSEEWNEDKHVLAVLHFNENLNRETQRTKDGKVYYKVTYPKFKLGEEVVREVAVPPTYNYVHAIRNTLFNTPQDQLNGTLKKYVDQVPDPLNSQFAERLSKDKAVERHLDGQKNSSELYPTEDQQKQLQEKMESSVVPTLERKMPTCRKCKHLMKGHPRNHCPSV